MAAEADGSAPVTCHICSAPYTERGRGCCALCYKMQFIEMLAFYTLPMKGRKAPTQEYL